MARVWHFLNDLPDLVHALGSVNVRSFVLQPRIYHLIRAIVDDRLWVALQVCVLHHTLLVSGLGLPVEHAVIWHRRGRIEAHHGLGCCTAACKTLHCRAVCLGDNHVLLNRAYVPGVLVKVDGFFDRHIRGLALEVIKG